MILKYEAFKMEYEENLENMFSKFQTLVTGLKVLDKSYSTIDHVKMIIRTLPKRWRPMVTALKLLKDLNNISLKELVISLRSHEIELEEDEPKRKRMFVAPKYLEKSEKTKAFQAEINEVLNDMQCMLMNENAMIREWM